MLPTADVGLFYLNMGIVRQRRWKVQHYPFVRQAHARENLFEYICVSCVCFQAAVKNECCERLQYERHCRQSKSTWYFVMGQRHFTVQLWENRRTLFWCVLNIESDLLLSCRSILIYTQNLLLFYNSQCHCLPWEVMTMIIYDFRVHKLSTVNSHIL